MKVTQAQCNVMMRWSTTANKHKQHNPVQEQQTQSNCDMIPNPIIESWQIEKRYHYQAPPQREGEEGAVSSLKKRLQTSKGLNTEHSLQAVHMYVLCMYEVRENLLGTPIPCGCSM